jgi:hypothetical protein
MTSQTEVQFILDPVEDDVDPYEPKTPRDLVNRAIAELDRYVLISAERDEDKTAQMFSSTIKYLIAELTVPVTRATVLKLGTLLAHLAADGRDEYLDDALDYLRAAYSLSLQA